MQIAKISQESKLNLNEKDYVASFSPELMQLTYAWCQGANFAQACKGTAVMEGSVIRALRNLEELLRQMCHAAQVIGNDALENKFADGITKIKRGVVFCPSLYL